MRGEQIGIAVDSGRGKASSAVRTCGPMHDSIDINPSDRS
jgi:N-acetylglutamate synthase/N-acetylornithine aminotransferase